MKKKVCVLGAGLVGHAIAVDLARDFAVTAVDLDSARLNALPAKDIATRAADLSDSSTVTEIASTHDIVVVAVPGFMGFATLAAAIAAGKPIVDISFFPEDALELDDAAKRAGVTAVVDCGVAPGLSNLVLGYHYARGRVTSFECMVGGLPVERNEPYQYKAPFSPVDVLEEYTRPARLVEDGKVVVRPALSEPELVDIAPVGLLEAFNSDGLRSLLNLNVPFMKEKTLRYPGHSEAIRLLVTSGLLSEDPVEINGHDVRPIDVTSRRLLPLWRLKPDDEELTVMRIVVHSDDVEHSYDLLDRYDPVSGTSSMARTTGYTCTGAVRLLAEGGYQTPGVHPPEDLGAADGCLEFIQEHLETRGVTLQHETRVLEPA